jgi:hypothetical protein
MNEDLNTLAILCASIAAWLWLLRESRRQEARERRVLETRHCEARACVVAQETAQNRQPSVLPPVTPPASAPRVAFVMRCGDKVMAVPLYLN